MQTILDFWNTLQGYKTYIVAAIGVLSGVTMLLDGQLEEGLQTILLALGLGTLRNGLANGKR